MNFIQKIIKTVNLEKLDYFKNIKAGTHKELEKEPLSINLPSREDINRKSEEDLEFQEILHKIDRAKELAKVMGSTIDREEFYCSLFEAKNILLDLTKYEDKYNFDPPPSKDLECLEERKKEQIDFLEYRIKEASQEKEEKSDSAYANEPGQVKNQVPEKQLDESDEIIDESQKILEEEIIESFKKQYFIPDSQVTEQDETNKNGDVHAENDKSGPETIQNTETSHQKEKEQFFQKPIDITQYAVMCNAYLDHQEEMEKYEVKSTKDMTQEIEAEAKQNLDSNYYEYILFSNNIDIPSIIGSRADYMRNDYTIDPRYNESWSYIHKLWKCSIDIGKVVKPKKFFEILEYLEESLKIIEQYSFLKFNPEKEREYYYSKKDEVLVSFLNRSFTDEYRNSLELKTAKGKISRIGNWFSVMEYYKSYLTQNALEEFERLGDKWQFEILPSLLEPESMKEI